MQKTKTVATVTKSLVLALILGVMGVFAIAQPTFAGKECGEGDDQVKTSIDLGCTGKGNPIGDLTFAIIRFLTVGVGLVVIGSIVVAGIQYTASSGDPQKAAAAIKRIVNAVTALALYLLIFALVNWLVPGGVF